MRTNKIRVFTLLHARIVLMILFQSMIYFLFIHKENTLEISRIYWPIYLIVVNILLLIWMINQYRKKGEKYFSFFQYFSKRNTIFFFILLVPLVITAMLPNFLLSVLLYQDIQIGPKLLLGDTSLLIMIINLSVFPVLQGLVELPFYFSYIMPKLESIYKNKWIFMGLPVIFLSVQHVFMPFQFDIVYFFYRSLMFFPFALFVGMMVYKKPTLMPYFVVLHILMNASLFMMYFM